MSFARTPAAPSGTTFRRGAGRAVAALAISAVFGGIAVVAPAHAAPPSTTGGV